MSSIEKRGERSWRLVVEAGYDAKGKRIKRYKTIKIDDDALLRTTKKLNDYLKLELSKFQIEVEAGEYIAPEKMTFGAFLSDWRKKYAEKELSPTTLKQHLFLLDSYIVPAFGTKRLDQIKPIHIVNFLSDIKRKDGKDEPLSSNSIEYIHRTLKNVFEKAVDWKILQKNPAREIKSVKRTKRKLSVYDDADIQAMFEALEDEPLHWRMMVYLDIATGMRRGEILALEWDHVDLELGTVRISQSYSMMVDGKAIVKGPKTESSNRTVTLPDDILDMLREYKQYCDKQRDDLGDAWEGQDGKYFVFFEDTGKPYSPFAPSRWFLRFLRRNNLKEIRFHDLRHTSASLLIKNGVHAKIISSRLGHSNIQTTMNVYGHVMQSADKEAANKLNEIFRSKKD